MLQGQLGAHEETVGAVVALLKSGLFLRTERICIKSNRPDISLAGACFLTIEMWLESIWFTC
jgi:hypothetical protein